METLSTNHANQPLGHPGSGPTQFVFNSTSEEEQGGFDFWGILGRRKWIVFLGLIAGMGLGTLVHYQSAPIYESCVLYTSPSPRDATLSRMPSSA